MNVALATFARIERERDSPGRFPRYDITGSSELFYIKVKNHGERYKICRGK